MNIELGQPFPLGATCTDGGVNFALFSANATRIELCVFDTSGKETRYDLPGHIDEVWHGRLNGAGPGLVYGYRAYGPYEPHNGHRFNPNKLLLDPYAKQLSGPPRWDDSLLGYKLGGEDPDLTFDERDSAKFMTKGVVTRDTFDWGDDRAPRTSWSDTVIYEAHVKGLTKLFDRIPQEQRGTYKALGHPALTDHLENLGVTALELLPVHAFLQDRTLVEKGLSNYWGYNTLSYFAPEGRYGSADDLRGAIKALHRANIEVILDVVYNHTCEGSALGATLSWRGLDHASYYRLLPEDRRRTINDTGTGNTLKMSNARVIQMVMDSLRYYVQSFHVDGFRFDLGSTLGREDSGFDPESGFFDALRQDPVLAGAKLISEPWDVGPGGYQLGNHPPPFSEWNDRYRDTVRRYWRSDPGQRPDLAERLSGSSDFFSLRRPTASINYVASHDGAALADLTMYEGKHNEANGEDNKDGIADNLSRNWGAEGPTADAQIVEIRERARRSLLTTLFCARGVPMLLGGDELGRTQKGNNNAYCQDNEISWIDWAKADNELISWTARLSDIRQTYLSLREDRFRHGKEILAGFRDLDWLDERGQVLSEDDWHNPEGRALVMRRTTRRDDSSFEILSLMMNASEQLLEFAIPPGLHWRLLLDSSDPVRKDTEITNDLYTLEAHSCALIVALLETPP
jgi:glycogen operon protein